MYQSAPPSVVSSWPAPNYVNPVTQGPALKIINIVSIVLGTCVVAARLYARFVLTKARGADDALIVVGLAFGIVFSALTIVATDNLGIGRHIWDVLPTNGSAIRLNLFIAQLCYTVSMTSIKISILLLYKRLSEVFSKTFLLASWIGIAYNIIYAISFCIILLLECRPVKAFWLSYDRAWATEHEYFCSSMERTAVPTYAALSVLGDVYSTILPLMLVSSLQLPLRRMLGLYALFALGFMVAGAGIVRTWFIYVTANKTYDTSWKAYSALFWFTFEMYLALLCACAPALKPFFKRYIIEPVKQYGTQTEGWTTRQGQNDTIGSTRMNRQSRFSNENLRKSRISVVVNEIPDLESQELSTEKPLPHIPVPLPSHTPSPHSGPHRSPSPNPSHSEERAMQETRPTSFIIDSHKTTYPVLPAQVADRDPSERRNTL